MNRNTGQTGRPSYGRVHISEAQKCLEDMESEDEGDASVPRNTETELGKCNPLSGISIVDVANKENRADYAYQLLGSFRSDLSARNTIYGPARFVTASSQAYRVKSALLPSKHVAKPENLHFGPAATADATKTTVLSTDDPTKPHNSQSVEDAIRNLSLNSRLGDKSRPDAAAKTVTSLSSLTEELKPVPTPYSQKPVGYSRVPVSCQKPDFDDDDDGDIGKKNSVQDVPHFMEDFSSFSAFANPPSSVSQRTGGDEITAAKTPSTSINFSELMASLEFGRQKVKTQKLDSKMADPDEKEDNRLFELANAGDVRHKSVRFTDIDGDPQKSHHHAESTSARELQPRSFRLDKSASASNLNPKPSRQPVSAFDVHERHFSKTSNTADAYQKPLQISELSHTGETYPSSLRNEPDSANFVALHQTSKKTHEFSSNTGDLYQKSLANQELSNTIDRNQQLSIVRDSQAVSSISQKLAVATNSVANPPLTAFSHLKDVKTLVINGNVYILLKVVGKGGSSKVYKAIAPDCKDCAVKCVSFATADESMISSYQNEIRLLQQLQNNEEVVKLYDYMFDEDANMLCVVMECGEMDLQTFFRIKESQTRILRMLVRPYWIQMLYAVQVLHKQGIVHSDLKPANFIVVCGRIKLIDFGIAKTVLPDCTSVVCDEIVGTFNYMSPEAVTDLNGGRDLTGESKPNIKISIKSDVWSLGCILYYLVYSRTPFENIRNQIMKLQAIMNPSYKIEFPATKIPHVVDVLKKCLDRNPKNRPTIEELLEHPYVTSD